MSNALAVLVAAVEEVEERWALNGEADLHEDEEEVDESPICHLSPEEASRTTAAFTNFSYGELMDLWEIGEEEMTDLA